MHFRIRKNVIQLIRSVYDKTTKKSVATVVGTVRLKRPELTPDLREKLTEDEIASFEDWVAARHRTDLLEQELAALTLANTMAKAQVWFERADEPDPADRVIAADIVRSWQSLRRALVKKGLLD